MQLASNSHWSFPDDLTQLLMVGEIPAYSKTWSEPLHFLAPLATVVQFPGAFSLPLGLVF
jgi:hypothetical protein